MPRSSRSGHLVRRSTPVLGLAGSACDGPQSALEPAGTDAAVVADLFSTMVVGAAIVWLVTVGLAVYAIVARDRTHEREKVLLFVVGGGAVLPTILLGALLVHGLRLMPVLLDRGPADGVRIHVRAEQWWWRVRYETPDGSSFELANELRLPVGRRTALWLESADVLHSLWVPSLAGKVDLIPGRVTRAGLEPTREGVFRGACAEYCGESHAHMGLFAVVLDSRSFEAWAASQRAPARPPTDPTRARGAELFTELGCGACHAIRGTSANGTIGPDLTHVGGRLALGAATLGSELSDFVAWLARTDEIKPGVHMPAFGMLEGEERQALASYLHGLR